MNTHASRLILISEELSPSGILPQISNATRLAAGEIIQLEFTNAALRERVKELVEAAKDFMDASEIAYQDLTEGQFGDIGNSRSGRNLKSAIDKATEAK